MMGQPGLSVSSPPAGLAFTGRGAAYMGSLILPWMLQNSTACAIAPLTSTDTPAHEATLAFTPGAEPSAGAKPSPTTFPSPSLPPPALPLDVVMAGVVGPQDRLYVSGFDSSGDDLRHFAEWDGARWIALGAGFRTAGHAMAVDAAGRLYTEALTDSSQGSSTALMRWNGDEWEDITGDFNLVVDALQPGRVSSNVPVTALAVDREGNLYAGGSFYYLGSGQATELPMGYVARWNGADWAVVGSGFDQVGILALAVDAPHALYAAGEQPLTAAGESGFLAAWHVSEWRRVDPGRPDIFLAMALDPSGGLYVAGQMQSTGGAFVDYWDGTHWTTIAGQFEGEAPAVFDLAVDAKGALCAGGSFESVDEIPASNIACWDGSTWHALGKGTNERVFGLAFGASGSLYAVGYFTEAGHLPVDHVARWDGKSWHTLSP